MKKSRRWFKLFVAFLIAIGVAVTFAVMAKAIILLIR